jgi:hypothetical protein
LQDQFEPFHAKFLAIRNSLCPKKFETGWEKLINEFPACEHYSLEFYTLIKKVGRVLLLTEILLLEFRVHNA